MRTTAIKWMFRTAHNPPIRGLTSGCSLSSYQRRSDNEEFKVNAIKYEYTELAFMNTLSRVENQF